MGKVTFKLDRDIAGNQLIRSNPAMIDLQITAINKVLSSATAQFFAEFGVHGKFQIVEFMTDRHSVKIEAADAKTAYVLKKHPGWMNQFNIMV